MGISELAVILIENQIRHNSSLCKNEPSSLTSHSNNTTRIIFG